MCERTLHIFSCNQDAYLQNIYEYVNIIACSFSKTTYTFSLIQRIRYSFPCAREILTHCMDKRILFHVFTSSILVIVL